MSKYTKLFIGIILLVAAAIYVVATVPTKFGLDIRGGSRVVLQADMDKLPKGLTPEEGMGTILRILETRVNRFGVSEPLIQPKGRDQIVIELPGVNKEDIVKQLQTTAQMEFRQFRAVQNEKHPMAKYKMSSERDPKTGVETYTFIDTNGNFVDAEKVIEESPLILTGGDLQPVSKVGLDPESGSVVNISFTKEGTKKFADFTRMNRGENLAIILDGKILSAPVIQATILDGKAQISGGFQSAEEAQRLTDLLNAGALPVPLKVVQQTTVEATIGKVAVDKSMNAGAVGLGLVILFMACYYLLPGLLADIALAIYALLSLAVFKLAHVTLTLPGIAAFILSIGMAVDANILIFERLKEELRGGKTLHAAVDAGFSRAFTSIFDSNMCTLITCAVLSYLGTGAIQGFAYVLALGVVISMFTAITTTRTLLHMVVNTKLGEVAWLYGLGRQWVAGQQGRSLNIVGRMGLWFALSAAVIIPGMIFWGTNGLKKGIDFTGGGFLQVSFQQPMTSEAISGALDNIGLTKSTVQKGENNEYFIRTKEIDPEKAPEVRNALKSIGGEVQSEEHVGGIVSKELTNNAIHSVLLASLLIVLYLSIRFAIGGFAQGFRFGMCAILATLHDVGVMIGIFAILGYFFNWEIDSLFITALLTVIGFSTHDTIVIFDRIRENLRHRIKGEDFEALVNRSINQSFARSINTSFTVVLTLVGLLLFGAHSTQQFIVALLVGVVTGTYSSIFNASQMLVLWQRITGRDVSGRSLVPAGAAKARDLKPLVDVSLKTPGVEEVQETTEEAAAETKAKAAKKRKKKY